VREGTVSSNLVVLVHGNCLLSKGGSRLSSVAAPHIFGQVSVYCNVPNPVSVITTTSAEFILLPKNHLIALVQSVAGLNSVAQRLEIDSSVGSQSRTRTRTHA
jgi:CRP-like cAMP-binding protein